jgi:hypothetical protein
MSAVEEVQRVGFAGAPLRSNGSGKNRVGRGEVVILDEAGMVSAGARHRSENHVARRVSQ